MTTSTGSSLSKRRPEKESRPVTALDSLQVGVLRSRAEIEPEGASRMPSDKVTLGSDSEGSCQGAPRGKRLCSRKVFCPRPVWQHRKRRSAQDDPFQSSKRAYEDVGSRISAAFLFANIVQPTVIELPGNFVQPTVIELPGNFSLESGESAYLVLHKALHGLRSASELAEQGLDVHHRPC